MGISDWSSDVCSSDLIAFGNFASAFYRMMDEPVKRQNNVPELNNLLIQNHVLASQITSAMPILAGLDRVPEGIQNSLDAVSLYLDGKDADPPASIETEGELADRKSTRLNSSHS